MKRLLVTVLSIGLFFMVRSARAEGSVAAEHPIQIHFDGGIGGSTFGVHAGGILLLRASVLDVGTVIHGSYFLNSKWGGGLVAGIGHHGASRLGFDALGEFGINEYFMSGGLLSGGDPGAMGSVTYAGARVGVNLSLGNRASRVRTTLGLWFYGQHDLQQHDARYTYAYRGSDWYYGRTLPPEQRTGTKRIGGLDELGVRVGVGFDLSPL